MVADAVGAVTAPALALGMHGLFSVDGRVLQVFVGQRETVVSATGSPTAHPWAGSPSPSVATVP